MKVTVLLPFRNAASTLHAAVTSIAEQTFSEWELLLVDNASTDESATITKNWVEKDDRIRLIEEPSVGIANALNTGMLRAKGSYIARMDADDISHPERLSKQVAYLDAHPEIGVLGTRTTFKTSVEQSLGMEAFVHWQNAIISPHEHFVKRFVDAPIAHPTVLFRRELVDHFGGYDTGPLPEDHELWLRWMHHGVRIAKLPDELLTWHDHPQRLSRTHSNYAIDAFFTTKVKWLAKWLGRTLNGRPVIIAGTSSMCRERAHLLGTEGIAVHGFTDVKPRVVPGYEFIPHNELPGPGKAFIVSFISQRGTGDRIAEFLSTRGLVEGEDFILAA
ncbi:MAG: glycosyltransferase family 2 protein [Flavobacteriales bacterium]|nr:glycosyltransferase family 2 protein [Flavobacteriales bacterium]MBP6642623.1 glycosyltransferase family 2 protein [Flavobacteriales bacterium]MBP7154413.1 glycosyltransferase family 2 protein [Flavobacteriales bacterium]HQV74132.1 glycosyltransferase family 2 protein [Flavobacteriales bacterium]HQW41044.1 glycosyltransferase family 2 protein [Flavobacteriales bacterium]